MSVAGYDAVRKGRTSRGMSGSMAHRAGVAAVRERLLQAPTSGLSVRARSTMHQINRPHRPDEATANFIYEAYQLLRRAPDTFGRWARQGAMENIAACGVSWRPVAISEAALRRIAESRSSKGCARGHWYDRKDRYDDLFGAEPLDRDRLISHFYDHDTTVVVTKEQNNAGGPFSKWGSIVPVPQVPYAPDGLFASRGYSFAVRQGKELRWVDERISELDQSPPAHKAAA